MALSNRDRVAQMFEVIAPALDAFISRVVGTQLPGGASWTKLVELKDMRSGAPAKTYSAADPQVQLRMLTESIPSQVKPGWYPFDGELGHLQKSYANELREYRNRWAHNDPFSDDEAYRALDTGQRLLAAIGAGDAADRISRIRLDLRRVAAEKDDRRTLRTAVSSPESSGLRPWRDVLPPHLDVATGNFQAAEFAADLFKVASGTDVQKDYADPVEFFARTYLTAGLRDLLSRALRRLGGDTNASPVVNLQTNFGGGKTHSMLALWHLAARLPLQRFPQATQELLAGGGYEQLPSTLRRVAIVGNHISPSGSVKVDGTQVNTLWGEVAWQLGGREAFGIVARADADRTPPGAALDTLLARYAPAVILIDEWVAYARALVGRDDLAGGTFDDQFTFAQALTETAKGTAGILLAISIPASESGDRATPTVGSAEEVGGAHGLEALRRLQNVVRRVADQWRPASSEEAYHIVRQRLFTAPDGAALASIGATARAFGELYRRYADQFPRESRDVPYEDRIKRTYPIHPELFDRLYEDWSSLERFQRTRGVLRLMNTVIHALWLGEDQAPLIMPGSIPIATATVNAELTQYLHDSWKAVIDADVDGPNSEPAKIDEARPLFGQRSLTKRLARTVFFGAAPTIGTAHKGIETQRVFLGTAVPGDAPGNFHAALTQLADRATYFYTSSGKYWYDLQANITRRARDQSERLHPEDVWVEIRRRLAGQARRRGDFAGVHVCPEDTADISDVDEARLVILHPRATHRRNTADSSAMRFAQQATERRGTGNRTYRNMLVFLAPDEDRMTELDAAVRNYLGWKHVLDNKNDLDLTQTQERQAADKQAQADQTVEARLLSTYGWALVPSGQPVTIQATRAEGQSEELAERVSRRLGQDGALSTQQAAAAIRHILNTTASPLWAAGHVRVGDLWRLYAEYAYMPRLRDRSVLTAGVRNQPLLWEHDGFALADGYDEVEQRYRGLVLPVAGTLPVVAVTDATLIVRPELAVAQQGEETAVPPRAGVARPAPPGVPGSGQAPEPAPSAPVAPVKRRFFGTKDLSADRYAMDFKKITDEVLSHLASTPGASLKVTIEIEATNPAGFDESRVRTISENARTLRFEQSGFEES